MLDGVFGASATKKGENKMTNEETKGLDALKELVRKFRAEPIELYRIDFPTAILNVVIDVIEKKRADVDYCADVITVYDMIVNGLLDSGDAEWKQKFEELKKPVIEKPIFYKKLEDDIKNRRFCDYHVKEENWGIVLSDFENLCNEFEVKGEYVSEKIPVKISSEVDDVEKYIENFIRKKMGCKIVYLKFLRSAIDERVYEIERECNLGWFVFDDVGRVYKECRVNSKILEIKCLKDEKCKEYKINLRVIEPQKESIELVRYDKSVLDEELINRSYERKALIDTIFKTCFSYLKEKGYLKPRVETGTW